MEFPTILVFYHFLGAVITSTRVSKKLGAYFSTFGGNPVSCAIGLAVLDVINNENLMSSARNVGKMLQDQLSELRVRSSLCIEHRVKIRNTIGSLWIHSVHKVLSFFWSLF